MFINFKYHSSISVSLIYTTIVHIVDDNVLKYSHEDIQVENNTRLLKHYLPV